MLSNAYFLAKFRFDTAENESAKKLCKTIANFANFAAQPHSPASLQRGLRFTHGRYQLNARAPLPLGVRFSLLL